MLEIPWFGKPVALQTHFNFRIVKAPHLRGASSGVPAVWRRDEDHRLHQSAAGDPRDTLPVNQRHTVSSSQHVEIVREPHTI